MSEYMTATLVAALEEAAAQSSALVAAIAGAAADYADSDLGNELLGQTVRRLLILDGQD